MSYEVQKQIDAYKAYKKEMLARTKEQNLLKAEEIRASIDIRECIDRLTNLYEKAEVCELEDLERLRFQASIVTTILKKALPDLKAIEISEKPNNAKKLIIECGPITDVKAEK